MHIYTHKKCVKAARNEQQGMNRKKIGRVESEHKREKKRRKEWNNGSLYTALAQYDTVDRKTYMVEKW